MLVFDIGGVLIEYGSAPRLLEWFDYSISEDELWRKWLLSPAVRMFEMGQSTANEFAVALCDEFGLPLQPCAFLDEFAVWPRALMPGAAELLKSLEDRFVLASCSNTNVLHWERVAGMDILDRFNAHFASHLTGCVKPDRETFQNILSEFGCAPHRICFFDDNPLNVEGAAAAGFVARHVHGPSGIAKALRAVGVEARC